MVASLYRAYGAAVEIASYASIVMTCERCGAGLPENARFCAQCGAPVLAATTEERKVVTVLFADLADSTKLAASLDPERFREVISAFFTTCSGELATLKGRAEKFSGDGVMAVFGVPHAHDDDAVRAVHAGVRIRDQMAQLGASLGVALQVRVGINTGPVAAGSGPADQFMISGAPVNLAARLQTAAGHNEILAGPTTQTLTSHAVRYGEMRQVAAKGFDGPVTAWPVDSLKQRATRKTLPMIGRRRELALLLDTYERVRETQRVHVLTLLGEAGIGKSRLVEQFVESLPEETRVLIGRATEFEEDPTFSALAEMLRRELGVNRETPRDQLSAMLRELVDGCCDPAESDRIAARLGLAVGLGDKMDGSPYEIAEIRSGLLSLLEGLTKQGPVALIFEDLEIARNGFLDLIEQTVARAKRLPLLLVCVARDALLELRPTWGGGMLDSVTIRLEPLVIKDGTDLARAAGEGLSEADIAQIVDHSGGNPFFIVETTGMLLAERHGHEHDEPHGVLLPPTVQAVVASRIDHLRLPAKTLLRHASVFPRSTFNTDELSLVAQADEPLLEELEDEDLLVRDDKRPGVWRFRHELLREVAYETLPKRERMRLHLAVADGLPDAERYPSVVAYHREQAARASLDLNPADRTLAKRAIGALMHAGDIQRRRIQSRTAIDLYERALSLSGPQEQWAQRQARIISSIGEARYWLGEYDEALTLLERAASLGGDDAWVRAHANRFIGDIALNVHGNLSRAEWTFDEAVAAARELGDPWAIGRTLLISAWAPYTRGDVETARTMLEEALQVAGTASNRDRWAEARALTFLSIVGAQDLHAEELLRLSHEALGIGEELDDSFTIATAQQTLASALRRLGRLEEAWEMANESVKRFIDLGAPWERASALGDRGNIARLLLRHDDAFADLHEAQTICRQLKEKTLGSWTASELARIMIARHELDQAQSLLRHPSTLMSSDEIGSRVSLANTAGLVALAAGDRDEACEQLERALSLTRERGWRTNIAAQTWVVAHLCGADSAGGEAAVAAAKAHLEEQGWRLILDRPDQALF